MSKEDKWKILHLFWVLRKYFLNRDLLLDYNFLKIQLILFITVETGSVDFFLIWENYLVKRHQRFKNPAIAPDFVIMCNIFTFI